MTTVTQLLAQVRQRVSPGRRDALNKLAGNIGASDTTFTFTYDGIASKHRISIGLEDIYLWDVSTDTKTVSACERGFNGSTAATHTSGDVIYDDAEFSPFEILRAVNETLDALPGEGIYNFRTVDLTGSASTIGYDLTGVGDLLGVHRVRYKDYGSLGDWITVPREMWTVRQQMPTADFASGESLSVYQEVAAGQTLEVLYRAPFDALSALTDDVSTVSDQAPPASMTSLLVVGAALRLTQGRPSERARLDAQGQTRRPQEVTTNDTRAASSTLELEWQRAVQRAKREQLRRYGV